MILLIVLLLASSQSYDHEANPPEPKRVVDLRGTWEFRLGDPNNGFRDGDEAWERIFVPSAWENEGYAGYDGFAWYRKAFKLPERFRDRTLFLNLGKIDDADEVFLNGRYLGSTGTMPPKAATAYDRVRTYRIPTEFLDFRGENILEVRVFDMRLEGGIVSGTVGIYELESPAAWTIDLTGSWRFQTGDNSAWRERDWDDSDWTMLTVPANWESQGFRDHDGYAWYRKTFYLPKEASKTAFQIVLGKIDDLDEAFVNGVRVGRTGDVDGRDLSGHEWQIVRRYDVPAGLLQPGEENVVAVRVFDGLQGGGIFEGPVGLVPTATTGEASKEETPFLERLLEWLSG